MDKTQKQLDATKLELKDKIDELKLHKGISQRVQKLDYDSNRTTKNQNFLNFELSFKLNKMVENII